MNGGDDKTPPQGAERTGGWIAVRSKGDHAGASRKRPCPTDGDDDGAFYVRHNDAQRGDTPKRQGFASQSHSTRKARRLAATLAHLSSDREDDDDDVGRDDRGEEDHGKRTQETGEEEDEEDEILVPDSQEDESKSPPCAQRYKLSPPVLLGDDDDDDADKEHEEVAIESDDDEKEAVQKREPNDPAYWISKGIAHAVAHDDLQELPEGAHLGALTAAHRLSRYCKGMYEKIQDTLREDTEYRAMLSGGEFSSTVQARARTTESNECVRERMRLMEGFAKFYNLIYHPRNRDDRFLAPPSAPSVHGAAMSTRRFYARMMLFYLEALTRFDLTWNPNGDYPAPSHLPQESRTLLAIQKDDDLAAMALADKLPTPNKDAAKRTRPSPKPKAAVDFRSGPAAETSSQASATTITASASKQAKRRTAKGRRLGEEEEEFGADIDLV